MSPRTLITRGLAATALAATVAIAGISPASAYSGYWYWHNSKTSCEKARTGYISSWTSVSKCVANGSGYAFRVIYYS